MQPGTCYHTTFCSETLGGKHWESAMSVNREPSGLRNGKFGHLKWPNFDPYPLEDNRSRWQSTQSGAPLASSKRMLIVSHTSTLDEAHSWTLVCSLVKRMLTISHTSTFHGACEISKHPSAGTTSLRSFYLRFSFSIVRLHFFRHAVLSRIINSQARRVNVTDNTTRSQSTFFSARFGRGRLGGRML